MVRRTVFALTLVAIATLAATRTATCQERGFARAWGARAANANWERFYHYPYVFYPQNYWGSEYYRSADSLYFRYPPEMRIPVYNKKWQNYYPSARPYHSGHHFILDVF